MPAKGRPPSAVAVLLRAIDMMQSRLEHDEWGRDGDDRAAVRACPDCEAAPFRRRPACSTRPGSRRPRRPCRGSPPPFPGCGRDRRDAGRGSTAAGDLRRRRARALLPRLPAGRPARAARSLPARDPEPRRLVRRDGRGARAARLRDVPARPARLRASPGTRGDFECPAQLVDDVRRFVELARRRARRAGRSRRRLLGRAARASPTRSSAVTSSPASRSSAPR